MAQAKNSRRRKKTHNDVVRDILCEHSPEAAQCLCDMLEDDSLSGTARAGVAKEILERAVGKGQLTVPDAEDKPESAFELILRVVE
ncbi:MAG: hypothetical protein ACI3XW_04425 [Butyricicoccus sp.]|nr:hypothetical protein [Clostridiales bacterium]